MLLPRSARIAVAAALLVTGTGLPVPPAAKAETQTEVKAQSLKLSNADVLAIKKLFKASGDALVAGDWDAWSKSWAKDAVLMPPGHPSIKGIEKIQKYIQAGFGQLQMFEDSDFTFEGGGDLAVVTTNMAWTLKDGSAKSGKQLVVLRKTGADAWRVLQVIYNANGGT